MEKDSVHPDFAAQEAKALARQAKLQAAVNSASRAIRKFLEDPEAVKLFDDKIDQHMKKIYDYENSFSIRQSQENGLLKSGFVVQSRIIQKEITGISFEVNRATQKINGEEKPLFDEEGVPVYEVAGDEYLVDNLSAEMLEKIAIHEVGHVILDTITSSMIFDHPVGSFIEEKEQREYLFRLDLKKSIEKAIILNALKSNEEVFNDGLSDFIKPLPSVVDTRKEVAFQEDLRQLRRFSEMEDNPELKTHFDNSISNILSDKDEHMKSESFVDHVKGSYTDPTYPAFEVFMENSDMCTELGRNYKTGVYLDKLYDTNINEAQERDANRFKPKGTL